MIIYLVTLKASLVLALQQRVKLKVEPLKLASKTNITIKNSLIDKPKNCLAKKISKSFTRINKQT